MEIPADLLCAAKRMLSAIDVPCYYAQALAAFVLREPVELAPDVAREWAIANGLLPGVSRPAVTIPVNRERREAPVEPRPRCQVT